MFWIRILQCPYGRTDPFRKYKKRSRKGIKSTNFVIFYGCLNKCLEHDARLYPNLNLPEGYPWQPHRFHRYRQSWCGKKTPKKRKKIFKQKHSFYLFIFFLIRTKTNWMWLPWRKISPNLLLSVIFLLLLYIIKKPMILFYEKIRSDAIFRDKLDILWTKKDKI